MTMRFSTSSSRFAPGFSFIELLFAVAVMGIGFIMIAAVFPIGLQQTKLTLDESVAASGARGSAARLQQLGAVTVQYGASGTGATSIMPQTYPSATAAVIGTQYRGQVRTFNDPRAFTDVPNTAARRDRIWQTVSNEMINPSDPRNASAVLYKRDSVGAANPDTTVGGTIYLGNNTAQLITINAQIATDSKYTLTNYVMPIYDLEPRPVAVQIVYEPASQHYVASFFSVKDLDITGGGAARGGYPAGSFTIATTPTATTVTWDNVLDRAVEAVTEGAFVVISDDRIANTAPNSAGRLNGRIFRLGNRRRDLETGSPTFDLAPGYDFKPDGGADGFVNTSTTPSTDDFVAIGADAATTTLRNNITYPSGTSVDRPLGATGPNGSVVPVVGSVANKGAVALVLGRGFVNPNLTPAAANGYTGLAQDISAYTTFITVSANK